MSRAEEIARKARRLADAVPSAAVKEQPAHTTRTASVRLSTDIAPLDHAELTRWCADTAQEIGRARIPGQEVVRALISRLFTDPELARHIRDTLTQPDK